MELFCLGLFEGDWVEDFISVGFFCLKTGILGD